ncbi:MAG: hypothetical protein BA874_09100 [Desulfuromonadales bacterium C00003068]|jgi:hypothetical protein|nr:MAG: hypothetical protein BA874_09100 [Desulfuromonadales bacterium C00003068]
MTQLSKELKLAQQKNQLMNMLSSLRIWIKILSSALVIVFGWLKLHGVSLIALTSSPVANFLLMITMIIYFFSWVFGALWDAHDQALVYLTSPNKGRLPIMAIGLMIIITVVFGILCWINSYRDFAMVLGAFWLINLIAWLFLVSNISKKAFDLSSNILKANEDTIELVSLNIVRDYIEGKWQWWRFMLGGLLILCINVLANTTAPSLIKETTSALSEEFIMVFSIFLFVTVVESWIWLARVKRRVSLNLLTTLRNKYDLNLKQ